ncbi:transposase [Streptomyces sp. ISL-10]|uniref:transposase n=1 Tax=Streptomyces sp. ISL-10 TaxID=2819172 RepID=UPI001BE97496|nr:transposase [Streptomyces sp. ISL-10]MBT2364572.1 transposase [Streptomyces sp. ISL-10]
MQRLLKTCHSDVDGVLDDVREHMIEYLGDPSGVLIVDVTSYMNRGTRSVRVQRQHSGTAGRTVKLQAWRPPRIRHAARVHADRPGPVPAEVMKEDHRRYRAAGIVDQIEFATKLQMTEVMVDRAITDRVLS